MQSNKSNQSSLDVRFSALVSWAAEQLGEAVQLTPASSDASFRRYFRTQTQKNTTFILMDAPPESENSAAFVNVAQRLQAVGVAVPTIYAVDLVQGFMLLEDLGTNTWLSTLNQNNAEAYFGAAIDTLVQMQQANTVGLPVYSEELLSFELGLFSDWYLAHHLQVQLPSDLAADFQLACDLLVQSALAQEQVFVHRDYMPRNLMEGEPNPRVIDFQDALLGPITYDLASLYKDAFISWPLDVIEAGVAKYWQQARAQGLPVGEDKVLFCQQLDWMGIQRHLKVIGIFARIKYRDGKSHYLGDVPRFFRYLAEIVPKYPELAPLQRVLTWVEAQQ